MLICQSRIKSNLFIDHISQIDSGVFTIKSNNVKSENYNHECKSLVKVIILNKIRIK